MSNRPAKMSQPRSRIPVRVGALERTLEDFNAEQGQKVALSIQTYHDKYIEPRLSWLETPWYQKLWIRASGVTKRAWLRLRPIPAARMCGCGAEPSHATGGMPECKYLMKELPDAGHG